jgi:hypothetical protein
VEKEPMNKDKQVSKEEFDAFVSGYGKHLESNVSMIYEPPLKTYNDFDLGDWPHSVVAYVKLMDGSAYYEGRTDEYFLKLEIAPQKPGIMINQTGFRTDSTAYAMLAAAPVPPGGDVEVLRNRLESARARFSRWNGRLVESLRSERAERDELKSMLGATQSKLSAMEALADSRKSEMTKALALLAATAGFSGPTMDELEQARLYLSQSAPAAKGEPT